MRRAPEISEFYGVEVSEYQIEAIQGRKVRETEACRLNQDTAHLFAHAYQNGHQVPSGARVEKTVKKNLAHFGRNEATVYRLDRAFKNYSYNPIALTFRKKKKIDIHPAPVKAKKQKAF